MEFIAVFFTHSGAIKYDRLLNGIGTKYELMPTPRKLTSNCSICAKFYYNGEVKKVISEDIEKLFSVKEKEYRLIYETE